MKKLYIIFTLVLWSCAQMASAQNMYREYQTGYHPRTVVSVVHSNGYVYILQADGPSYLSVTEIDPLNMLPTGNDKSFIINQQSRIVYLNGGFEDANGDFVLFGYMLESFNIFNPQYPTYIKIKQNLSSCEVYYELIPYGEITAGCDGYDLNAGEVYMFVNGRELLVVEPSSPTSIHRLMMNTTSNPNDYFTDISWDSVHEKFIATGSAWNTSTGHECPFVEVFELLNDTIIVPVAEYYIDNQPLLYSSEYKSLHVQLDNNNLMVYHDLRRRDGQDTYDNIWLTRINNFWDFNIASVTESRIYELANAKLMAKDMVYDPYNNRLNFLGVFSFNKNLQILAQTNPYSLSSGMDIGQLGIGFNVNSTIINPQDPYIPLYANDFEMFNLALDIYNPCYPVLIAGVDQYSGESILTETYNIANSLCDVPLWKKEDKALPMLKVYSLKFTLPQPNVQSIYLNSQNDIIYMNYLCNESAACSHQYGGKSLKQPLTGVHLIAEVTIEADGFFVCDGFDGNIQYSLYDMAGKLLQQGETRNGERNSLRMSNGFYLLKAYDTSGNQIVKKVILL